MKRAISSLIQLVDIILCNSVLYLETRLRQLLRTLSLVFILQHFIIVFVN